MRLRPLSALLVPLALSLATPAGAAAHHAKNKHPTAAAAKKPAKKPAAKPAKGAKPAQAPRAAASPPPASAPPANASASPRPLALSVQKATLDNGLRVVMNVDRTSPTVAVAVTYDVGARNEERGRSGFAHLFEHMMFEGSANVPKGEHFKLVSSHGGTLNGTTSSDRTNYFEMLPSNELPLALWLEADRMKSLDVSQENFENQRKVVEEEYRMRVSNVAYAPAQIRLEELAYQGYWPYEHDAIGSMHDLDNAQLEWVKQFHDAWYAPNLAVLSISGDFDPDEAMTLVHRFFDTAKRQEHPIPYSPPPLPEQTSPRTAVLEDPHAKTPGFFYGWVIPESRKPEHYALELAASILTDGESSRLYQKLVRDKAVATEVSAGTEDHRGPDLWALDVKLADGAKLADVEKLVDAEIDALAKRGPTDAEMLKVRNRTEAAFLFGLQSNLQRAIRLGQYETFFGDARLLNQEPGRYLAVTKDDIQRAVAQYLTQNRRTLVEVRETGEAAPAPPEPKRPAAAPAAPKPGAGAGHVVKGTGKPGKATKGKKRK